MERSKEILRNVSSFSDTLSLIFDVVRDGFKSTMKATLIYCGPWLVIMSVLLALAIGWLLRTIVDLESNAVGSEWDALFDSNWIESVVLGLLFVFVILVLYGVASTIQMGITYLNVKHYNDTGLFAPPDVLRVGMRKLFWRLLLASIVSTIMVNIGMQFFYIPGIFVSVPLAMLMAGMVADNIGLSQALPKVFTLIKRRWWFSFGIIFLCGLTQFVVACIVMVPFVALIMGIASLAYGMDVNTYLPVLGALVSVLLIIAMSLTNYIAQAAHMVLYYRNSEASEGISLQLRIAAAFPADERSDNIQNEV